MSNPDLRDAILNGLADRLTPSGAMATGNFILVAEVIDGDGTHATFVATQPTQPTHTTMGLLAYAQEWYRTEANLQMLGALDADLDDEDD